MTCKWRVLIATCIGVYMATLDSSIVNISFPRLAEVFHTDPSVVLWVAVAYLLVSVSLVFVFGRMGDAFGRKKIYTIGFGIFTAGLVLCTLSRSILQLILARVFQGVGAAMTMSLGTAIVTSAFPAQERGKALGISGATVSAGLLSGPVIGGLLLDALDWQAIFYVTIPVAVAGMVMAILWLKEQKVTEGKFRFDWPGAVSLSAGLASLLLFFNMGGKRGFGSLPVLALGAAAVVLITTFLMVERRAKQPVLDLSLFRNRLFAAANISLFIMFIALSTNPLLMPFYLIDGLGFDASRAGLLFATVSMAALITGPLSGWLSDKIGYRVLCTAGIAMMACGLFWLSRLGSSAGPLDILPRLAVMGLGSGLFSSPNNSSIMGSVPRERLSTGSAMIATVRQVGMSTGTAVAGAIYTSRQAWHAAQLGGTTIDVHKLSLISGYRDTLLVAAIVCAVAVIPSAMRGKAVAAPKSPGAQGAPQA